MNLVSSAAAGFNTGRAVVTAQIAGAPSPSIDIDKVILKPLNDNDTEVRVEFNPGTQQENPVNRHRRHLSIRRLAGDSYNPALESVLFLKFQSVTTLNVGTRSGLSLWATVPLNYGRDLAVP